MPPLPAFTPAQEQVLALLSAGATLSAAAQSAGVHRNTILNWRHSLPGFRDALSRAHYAKALYWRDQAEQLASAALDAIRATLTDASVPASVRLKAAQSILALATTPPPEPCEPQPPSLLDLFTAPPRAAAPLPVEAEPPAAPVHNSAQPAPAPAHEPASCVVEPIRRAAPKTGRNEPCPCGSGKKFKRCCGSTPSGAVYPAA